LYRDLRVDAADEESVADEADSWSDAEDVVEAVSPPPPSSSLLFSEDSFDSLRTCAGLFS
jgi:hypothetical protein